MAAHQVTPRLAALILISSLVFSSSLAIKLSRCETQQALRVVNRKGPYLGLVTVYTPEEEAFFKTGAFRPDRKRPFIDLSGDAAAATQQMLDLLVGIVHFGIASNANASMSIGDVTVPKQFIHTGLWEWLGMELEQCVNSTRCLPQKPKLVVGLRGSTANSFVDNAAYRDFLSETFNVSSMDMESSAIVMTSLSNGFPLIVIRGLSDGAGSDSGQNGIGIFGSLAALNAAKAVIQFVKLIPEYGFQLQTSPNGPHINSKETKIRDDLSSYG
ncbi:Adenosylhomocysteine nucleosidase [Bertholletia excelsa]